MAIEVDVQGINIEGRDVHAENICPGPGVRGRRSRSVSSPRLRDDGRSLGWVRHTRFAHSATPLRVVRLGSGNDTTLIKWLALDQKRDSSCQCPIPHLLRETHGKKEMAPLVAPRTRCIFARQVVDDHSCLSEIKWRLHLLESRDRGMSWRPNPQGGLLEALGRGS